MKETNVHRTTNTVLSRLIVVIGVLHSLRIKRIWEYRWLGGGIVDGYGVPQSPKGRHLHHMTCCFFRRPKRSLTGVRQATARLCYPLWSSGPSSLCWIASASQSDKQMNRYVYIHYHELYALDSPLVSPVVHRHHASTASVLIAERVDVTKG